MTFSITVHKVKFKDVPKVLRKVSQLPFIHKTGKVEYKGRLVEYSIIADEDEDTLIEKVEERHEL